MDQKDYDITGQHYDLLIVDDHELVREGLKAMFHDVPWARIVGEARNAKEALAQVEAHLPDLVVIDPCMLGDDGLACLKMIKDTSLQTKILVLTDQESEDLVYDCLNAGANGYIVKKATCQELLQGVQAVLEGKSFLSPGVLYDVAKGYLKGRRAKNPELLVKTLTRREAEVFELVGQGRKNREIAAQLYISIKTVEKHRANMMRKLRLKSPVQVRHLWADFQHTS